MAVSRYADSQREFELVLRYRERMAALERQEEYGTGHIGNDKNDPSESSTPISKNLQSTTVFVILLAKNYMSKID